jgi:type VI secretion system secreted protein VgrG
MSLDKTNERVPGASEGTPIATSPTVADSAERALRAAPAEASDLVRNGAPRVKPTEELPVFDEIAVTSSTPKKATPGAVSKVKGRIAGGTEGFARKLGEKNIEAKIASGDPIDVRQFSVHERLSALFQINLEVVSHNSSIDFDDVVGLPATLSIAAGKHDRSWSGVCNHFEQVRVEPSGLSTYQLSIVPTLWLLTQRKNHRIFQQMSEPDIVALLLAEWGIAAALRLDKGAHKKRKYRVQYAESDFAFMSRMLEDAGITFSFEQDGDDTKLVLSDAPQASPKRGAALVFMDDTSMVNNVAIEFATAVRMGQRVRPGKYTMRDHDYRKPPTFKLMSSASKGLAVEERLESFHYAPGAFLFGTDAGDSTPSADDKGKTRTDEKAAALLAQKRLDAERGGARVATFETNAYDLAPGVVTEISGHPHAALSEGKTLVVVETELRGTDRGEWSQRCEVRGTDAPLRPELSTPRPKVSGVESATVVGPPGEEIHTDEFGRVRVHFHWDRESKMDDNSSCWIHVSQPWGGSGYGATNLPRVGHEVLVDFLGGDPDRPVIVGRVYTNLQRTPYKLPDKKTQSGWKSQSSPGGGPDNFNEIMFEDRKGQELVRIQAEKDLNKLVKHDEHVTIGNDRATNVGRDTTLNVGHDRTSNVGHDNALNVAHDDSSAVGNDRTCKVVHDDSLAVGNDRAAQVGRDDSLTVGHDRACQVGHDETVQVANDGTRFVGNNESVTVGNNRTEVVGENHSETIGSNKGLTVGGSSNETVKLAKNEMVGLASAETVGLAKALTVGAAYSIMVAGSMTTKVGTSQTETVGTTKIVTVGEKLELICGAASITLEKSGKITMKGTELELDGKKIKATGTEKVEAFSNTIILDAKEGGIHLN